MNGKPNLGSALRVLFLCSYFPLTVLYADQGRGWRRLGGGWVLFLWTLDLESAAVWWRWTCAHVTYRFSGFGCMVVSRIVAKPLQTLSLSAELSPYRTFTFAYIIHNHTYGLCALLLSISHAAVLFPFRLCVMRLRRRYVIVNIYTASFMCEIYIHHTLFPTSIYVYRIKYTLIRARCDVRLFAVSEHRWICCYYTLYAKCIFYVNAMLRGLCVWLTFCYRRYRKTVRAGKHFAGALVHGSAAATGNKCGFE